MLPEMEKTSYHIAPHASLGTETEKLKWDLILPNTSISFENFFTKLFVNILLLFFAYLQLSFLEQ